MFPSELGVRGELIPDPGFHHFLKKSFYPPFFVVEVGGET